jgi:hypothetical protein
MQEQREQQRQSGSDSVHQEAVSGSVRGDGALALTEVASEAGRWEVLAKECGVYLVTRYVPTPDGHLTPDYYRQPSGAGFRKRASRFRSEAKAQAKAIELNVYQDLLDALAVAPEPINRPGHIKYCAGRLCSDLRWSKNKALRQCTEWADAAISKASGASA